MESGKKREKEGWREKERKKDKIEGGGGETDRQIDRLAVHVNCFYHSNGLVLRHPFV